MRSIYHPAEARGSFKLDWLHSKHSFSFGHYYDPAKVNFGKLRVLNDDIVKPGMGFTAHPHENMEIVSIPIRGSLSHKDSKGNEEIITAGEVQRMTAGTGIIHSEFNPSNEEDVNFLQIWILPEKENIHPAYEQKKYSSADRQGKWQLVISPKGTNQSVSINQQCYISWTELSAEQSVCYSLHNRNHGVYFFNIFGRFEIQSQQVVERDGFGLQGQPSVDLVSHVAGTEILAIEIPIS
jgi:quercetin 2,3-dioxygenase